MNSTNSPGLPFWGSSVDVHQQPSQTQCDISLKSLLNTKKNI